MLWKGYTIAITHERNVLRMGHVNRLISRGSITADYANSNTHTERPRNESTEISNEFFVVVAFREYVFAAEVRGWSRRRQRHRRSEQSERMNDETIFIRFIWLCKRQKQQHGVGNACDHCVLTLEKRISLEAAAMKCKIVLDCLISDLKTDYIAWLIVWMETCEHTHTHTVSANKPKYAPLCCELMIVRAQARVSKNT